MAVAVAPGVVAFGLNKICVALPEVTDHVPEPIEGVLPPSDVLVPLAQIDWLPPTVAVDGDALTAITGELIATNAPAPPASSAVGTRVAA